MINTQSFFKISLLALSCSASTFTYADPLNIKQGNVVDATQASATLIDPLLPESALATVEKTIKLTDADNLMLESQPMAPGATIPVASQPKTKLKPAEKLAGLAAEIAAITPLCQTLNTGVLYTLSNSVVGNASCFHFEITERAKTTALLVGQNAQTDANLTIFRHEADDSLSVVGTSTNTGNADEVVLALTELGHYYWYIDVVAADGGDFNFAAVANTDADAYELNDSVALSTALPDKFNKLSGNMDSASDVDYYHFTAVRGQDTIISLVDSYNNNEWLLEFYNGGWQTLGSNQTHSLTGLPANQVLNIRVTPNPAVTVDPSHDYQLSFGSKAVSFGPHSVAGESNVTRVSYGATEIYLTTQAYRDLNWTATINDSTGQPIEGIEVVLKVDKHAPFSTGGAPNYVDYSQLTDSTGQAVGSVNLGTCSGEYTSEKHYEYKFGTKNWWITNFNYGVWRIEVPGYPDLGVGGNNVQYVVLGHLCRQTYLPNG